MRPVLCLFFLCSFLFLGVAEEDYRAHLEKAFEVMAPAPWSIGNWWGWGSGEEAR